MKRKQFKPSHLFLGMTGLLILQLILFSIIRATSADDWIIIIFSLIGAFMNMYVAIEAIEEVNGKLHTLGFLSLIVFGFILFFAFQYWFLEIIQPGSFPNLEPNFLNFVLHSSFVFVFNPIYLPANEIGRILLLINTLSSLGLVLFILQNIGQLKENKTDKLF